MKLQKKGQTGIEFLLLLAGVLTVSAIVLYLIGSQTRATQETTGDMFCDFMQGIGGKCGNLKAIAPSNWEAYLETESIITGGASNGTKPYFFEWSFNAPTKCADHTSDEEKAIGKLRFTCHETGAQTAKLIVTDSANPKQTAETTTTITIKETVPGPDTGTTNTTPPAIQVTSICSTTTANCVKENESINSQNVAIILTAIDDSGLVKAESIKITSVNGSAAQAQQLQVVQKLPNGFIVKTSKPIELIAGENTIIAEAIDNANNKATKTIKVYTPTIQGNLQSCIIKPTGANTNPIIIQSEQTKQFTIEAGYADGTTKNVTATEIKALPTSIGTITSTGFFTANKTTTEQTGVIMAGYSEGGQAPGCTPSFIKVIPTTITPAEYPETICPYLVTSDSYSVCVSTSQQANSDSYSAAITQGQTIASGSTMETAANQG